MHSAIFGATGVTGRCLVEQALDQGYDVTAFARNPASVTTQHVRLSMVRGDVFDPATVQEAVANQDAVLCTIGGQDRLRVALSGHPRSPGLCTIGTRNILDAMKTLGLSRLICLSAWGIGDSRGRVPCSSIQAHQWAAHGKLPDAIEPGVFLAVAHLTCRCRGLYAETTHRPNFSTHVSRTELLRRKTSRPSGSLERSRRRALWIFLVL